MAGPHLGVGDAHAAEVGGHHQLVVLVRPVLEEHLAAEFQRLLAVGAAELVEVGAVQALDVMDVAVHAGVEPLVFGHADEQFRVEQDLVEQGVVGVDAELLLRPGEHGGTRDLRAGAGQGGHGRVVYGRVLDQVPALVVGGRPGVGEQERNGLGDVHGAAAAQADDAVRQDRTLRADAGDQLVDVAGLGLVDEADRQQQVALFQRQPAFQLPAEVDVVEHEDHGRPGRDPPGFEDVAELVEGAAAEDDVGHYFEISVHRRVSLTWMLLRASGGVLRAVAGETALRPQARQGMLPGLREGGEMIQFR